MIRRSSGGVEWLEFEIFADFPRIKHAIFLRKGGISQGGFRSLNLSDQVGDNPKSVQANRALAAKLLGLPALAAGVQCHGKDIFEIRLENHADRKLCDALVTDQPDIGLMINHADCQAALFYDPIKHVIANVHSGWKGNVQNIYHHVIAYLTGRFGCLPQNLLVGISPSLGPHSAEFVNYRTELPEMFWDFQIKPNYFDLWEISRWQLCQSGILDHHIQIAAIDTLTNEDDYFSYRREKITGRNGLVASILK